MRSKSNPYSRYFTYIKPLTKFPLIRNYGPTIFTLLTMSILIFFAIKPTVETILVLQKRLVEEEKVLQKVTEKANNLSLGKENYDNLDISIKEKIATAIPDTVSIKSVIQALEQTSRIHEASISALQIQSFVIDPKHEDAVGILSEISFIFNLEGDYQNLNALLRDLKISNRLISIDSVSISKVNEGPALIMSITGKAYYIK